MIESCNVTRSSLQIRERAVRYHFLPCDPTFRSHHSLAELGILLSLSLCLSVFIFFLIRVSPGVVVDEVDAHLIVASQSPDRAAVAVVVEAVHLQSLVYICECCTLSPLLPSLPPSLPPSLFPSLTHTSCLSPSVRPPVRPFFRPSVCLIHFHLYGRSNQGSVLP
jgi:hypothetical protein